MKTQTTPPNSDRDLLIDIFSVPAKPTRRRPTVKNCVNCRQLHRRRRPGPFYLSEYCDQPFCAECRDIELLALIRDRDQECKRCGSEIPGNRDTYCSAR